MNPHSFPPRPAAFVRSLAFIGLAAGGLAAHARADHPNVVSICSGDGSGTQCPCGNNGSPGNGCANSFNPAGARIFSSGSPYTDADTFRLDVTGLPPTTAVWFRQGANAHAGNVGVPFNDGLICYTGSMVRLGQKEAVNGTASFGHGVQGDPQISTQGGISAGGGTRVYQAFYRNSQDYCTSGVLNATNGLLVAWTEASGGPGASVGQIVAKGEPRGRIGCGYDFIDGVWVVKEPIFHLPTPLTLDTPYEGSSFDVFNYRSATDSYSSTQQSADVTGSIGVVKVGASYSQSEATTASSENTAMGFVFRQKYEPKLVAYANPANYILTSNALAVLAIADPALRAQRWREEFGKYVAVGLDIHGHLGVKVSVSNFNSTKTRSQYVSLTASYGASTGSGSMASASHMALSSEGIDLSWEYAGDVPLSGVTLPVNATDLDEPGERNTFVQSLHDRSLNAKAVRGLIVIPASSFPNAPNLDMSGWDAIILDTAGRTAQLALAELHSAQAYNFPAALRWFLAGRPIVDSNGLPDPSGHTYGFRIDKVRSDMVDELDELWTRMKAHLANPTNEALKTALQAQTQVVENTRNGIGETISLIDGLKNTLPPITVSLSENFSVPGAGCDGIHRQFSWVIDNVAAFTDGSYQQRYDWLAFHRDADFSIRLLETGGCVTPNFPHFSEAIFPPAGIDEYVYSSGPQKGLKRLTFTHNAYAVVSSPVFRAEVVDDFARLGTHTINANHQ